MEKKQNYYPWFIVVTCCLLQGCGIGIYFNCAGLFLAPVAKTLGCGIGSLAIYMTLQAFGLALVMPIVGKWLPTKNVRVLISGSVVICALMYVAMAFSTSLYHWYIFGTIMGFANAFVFFAPTPVILSQWFAKKTGTVIGIATAFSGVGGAIFAQIGNYVIIHQGWQMGYIVLAVISCVCILPFTMFILRFKPADIGLKPYGLEDTPSAKGGAPTGGTAEGVAAADALKSAAFVLAFLAAGFSSLSGSFYQHIKGYSLTLSGDAATMGATFISACMIGNIAGKLSIGAVNDKAGGKTAIGYGLTVIFISILLMLFGSNSVAMMMVGTFLYGFTLAMISVGMPLITKTIFGLKDFSKIYSYITMGTAIIGALGIPIIGFIYDSFREYSAALVFVCICSVISIILAFAAFAAGHKLKARMAGRSISV